MATQTLGSGVTLTYDESEVKLENAECVLEFKGNILTLTRSESGKGWVAEYNGVFDSIRRFVIDSLAGLPESENVPTQQEILTALQNAADDLSKMW